MPLPQFDNTRGLGDRISSAACPAFFADEQPNASYVDTLYGHTWSFVPKPGAAVYGLTDRFPASPIDHLARGRFLRVPFRRVPVIEVGSPEDLAAFAASIVSADDSIRLRWRGQVKEHYLQRQEDDLLRLFGSTSVREPSLVPSAARASTDFSKIFPAWSAVLDLYLGGYGQIHGEADATVFEQITHFRASYNYRLWALATAQHYGLPSVGLDITTDLWTAVLFALHEFTTDLASGRTVTTRVPAAAEPVLYAMAGFEGDLIDDAAIAPAFLQCERPKAQAAHFFGTGWGAATNKAAERIFVAFRLLNHHKWLVPKSIDELFPPRTTDSFVAFLLRTRDQYPEIAAEANLGASIT